MKSGLTVILKKTAFFVFLMSVLGFIGQTEVAQAYTEEVNTVGGITVTGSSDYYVYSGDYLYIREGASLKLSSEEEVSTRIDLQEVSDSTEKKFDLTLSNLKIKVPDNNVSAPIWIPTGYTGDVNITLEGDNVLTGGGAGIYKGDKGTETGTLTIGGTGSLTATSHGAGAGIGGSRSNLYFGYHTSNIVINSGTIIANGSSSGAGIGGGNYGDAKNITIHGGNVIATGGESGAGIGGGAGGSGSNLYFYGGNTTANGGKWGAGIGGGNCGKGKNVVITGANVKAKAGSLGNDIGGGSSEPSVEPTNGREIVQPYRIAIVSEGAVGSSVQMSDCDDTIMRQYEGRTYTVNEESCLQLYLPKDVTDAKAGFTLGTDKKDVTLDSNSRFTAVEYKEIPTILNVSPYSGVKIFDGYCIIGTNVIRKFDRNDGITISGNCYKSNSVEFYNQEPVTVHFNGYTFNGVSSYFASGEVKYNPGIWLREECKGDVNLVFSGTNVISGACECAGIQKDSMENTLTIGGSGTLNVSSHSYGAGIGAREDCTAKHIVIESGEITAIGGCSGAGIGGGENGNAEDIQILGGNVKAVGGENGAGIGGGKQGTLENIVIKGGNVKATKGLDANDIGGGYGCLPVTPTNGTENVYLYKFNMVGTNTTNQQVTVSDVDASIFTPYNNQTYKSDEYGKLYFYLPQITTSGKANFHITRNEEEETKTAYAGNSNRITQVNWDSIASKTTYDMADGVLTICDGYCIQNGVYYSYSSSNTIVITGTLSTSTDNGVFVNTTEDVTIKLKDATITSTCYRMSALYIADNLKSNVNLILEGTNTLKSTLYGSGISKGNTDDCTEVGTLTISGTGTLNASTTSYAAGIGGSSEAENFSNCIINGGTIVASSYGQGAGIGGKCQGNLTNLHINGGDITAIGGKTAPGIGCGYNAGSATDIYITGGKVTAIGTSDAAGIGSGSYTGELRGCYISGGTVIAKGAGNGAGIGAVKDQRASNVKITGGSVKATMGDADTNVGFRNSYDVNSVPVNAKQENLKRYTLQCIGTNVMNQKVTFSDGDDVIMSQYGNNDIYTDDCGKIYLWLPDECSTASVKVKVGSYTAKTVTFDKEERFDNILYATATKNTYDISTNPIYVYDNYCKYGTTIYQYSMDDGITVTGTTTTNSIYVQTENNTSITLNGISIEKTAEGEDAPIAIADGNKGDVLIRVVNDNILNGSEDKAVIEKNGTGDVGTLKFDGTGSLTTTKTDTFDFGASIGASVGYATQNIEFYSGTYHITNYGTAAIGARSGEVSNISIFGGTLTVIGEPAIGSSNSAVHDVKICGGKLDLTGNEYSPVIGSYGSSAEVKDIQILGGNVKLTVGDASTVRIGGYENECIPVNSNGEELTEVKVKLMEDTENACKDTAVTSLSKNEYGSDLIFYGLNDVKTDTDGYLYLYLPEGAYPVKQACAGFSYQNTDAVGVENVLTKTQPFAEDITVTQSPKSVTADVLTEAAFSVEASCSDGTKELSYQWQKQTEGAWKNVSNATGTAFSLSNITIEDEANYRCVVAASSSAVAISEEATLSVNRLSQTIQLSDVGDKTWGDAAFDLTLSDEGMGSGEVTYSASKNSERVISLTGANVSIKGPGTVTITATKAADNIYEEATCTMKLVIQKKAMTITAKDAVYTIGGTLPTFKYSYDGLIPGYYDYVRSVQFRDTAGDYTTPGTYELIPYDLVLNTGNQTFYDITYVPATLTIKEVEEQNIKMNPIEEHQFGDKPIELSLSEEGKGTGDVIYSVPQQNGVLNINGDSAAIIGAGTVTVSAIKLADDGYRSASTETSVTIAKRDLRIKAVDKSMYVGEEKPELTYTVDGLVYGDTIENVMLSDDAGQANTVGDYTITITGGAIIGGSLKDYNPIYTDGTLSVRGNQSIEMKAVDGKTYGDGSFLLELADAGKGTGEITYSVPNENGVLSIEGNQATIIGAGTVMVTAVKQKDSFYSEATAIKQITIAKKKATVTANDITMANNQGTPSYSCTTDGFVGNDAIYIVSYGTNCTDYTVAGEYTITPSGGTIIGTNGGNNDYDITYKTGVLKIYTVSQPTASPSASPTASPTVTPSTSPTASPTVTPSTSPTASPTVTPSTSPTASPTVTPSTSPTASPTVTPSTSPTASPTVTPSASPTASPSVTNTIPSNIVVTSGKTTVGTTKIVKLKGKKKSAQITILLVKGAQGYEVQYSTSKKMKKSKKVILKGNKCTKKRMKKLKSKKKYYIRVRAYKVVLENGIFKKKYSKWSKQKSVKIK